MYLADDDNRVKLKAIGGSQDCQHSYINASYVNVSLYAWQGSGLPCSVWPQELGEAILRGSKLGVLLGGV